MLSQSSPRGARVFAVALLFATFAAGGLSGAAVVRVLAAQEATASPGPGDPGEKCGPRRGGRILDQLDLTPEQRVQVDRILERRRAETEAFWEKAGPELRKITESTRAEIRAVLTPEQREKYDRLREERRASERERDRERHKEHR